jgi:glycosyltransferase involved in cell wall biosynthesis
MTSKLLSIIIPAYNCKETLPNCLNSILGQKFSNFELILIDNGSTDATKALYDGYKDKDSRVIVHHMRGHSEKAEAWNVGLDKATGRYILLMDATDYIEDNTFEKFKDQLWQDFDVIFLKAHEILPNGTKQPLSGFDTLAGQSHSEVLQKFNDIMPDRVWDKLIRRRVLEENQIRFTSNVWEDADFCMSLYLCAKTYGVLAALPYYCRSQQQPKDPEIWCQRLILTLGKWTGAAGLGHRDHSNTIHHWMAAIYCDILFPLYAQLPKQNRKTMKGAMDDFVWLLDVRKTKKDQRIKKLYDRFGPWAAHKILDIGKSLY